MCLGSCLQNMKLKWGVGSKINEMHYLAVNLSNKPAIAFCNPDEDVGAGGGAAEVGEHAGEEVEFLRDLGGADAGEGGGGAGR